MTKGKGKQNTKDIATQGAAMIPAGYGGFTPEEAEGGMGAISTGYLNSFPYFMSVNNGVFMLRDNVKRETIWEGESIDQALIYYGHEMWRLKRGHVMGLQTPESSWSDEENELVALSYDKRSRGNFGLLDKAEYLSNEHKDLHSRMKRFYYFIMAPKLPSGKAVIACSGGITTATSFRNYRKEVDKFLLNGEPANLPLCYVTGTVGAERNKNDNDEVYFRTVFHVNQKEDGSPVFPFKGREAWLASENGKPMLDKIIETHQAAVKEAENRTEMGSSPATEVQADSVQADSVQGEDGFVPTDTDASSNVSPVSDDDSDLFG